MPRTQSMSEAAVVGLLLGAMVAIVQLFAGCQPPEPTDAAADSLLDTSDAVIGSDGIGPAGPPDASYSTTAVWDITADWADTDTAAAREAGPAWQADSGLSWEQKYSLWVDAMTGTDAHAGYYTTFEITNPQGVTLPSPYLECAEMAYFLRVLFASWYGLPFFVEAADGNGRIFAGHFGFVTDDGGRWGGMPSFAKYDDHSGLTAAQIAAQGWPSDGTLAGRQIPGNSADEQPFLGDDAHFGAYLDQLLLNKRVGYFMLMLLPYFGSIHLAEDVNAYHVAADRIRPGDVLLERWQATGIGHTMVVKEVQWIDGDQAVAELVSGSMPRRQGKWESSTGSKMYFTNDYCGGPGYAALGGGLKSFTQAVAIGGRWHNRVPAERMDAWIPWNDEDARAARVEAFEELLATVSASELAGELEALIEDRRNHLRTYPASCSARISREEYFAQLYDLASREWGWSRQRVDEEYRVLDDYVFAELVYGESRTCCWNSTTPDMYAIVMDYNLAMFDADPDTCVDPVVFKAEDGGYETFRAYAESTGRADQWVPWSEDETCPQADVEDDTEVEHVWTEFCDVAGAILPGDAGAGSGDDDDDDDEDPTDGGDAYEPNEDADAAAALGEGSYSGLHIGADDDDWFVVDAQGANVTARITFSHAAGDLDLKLYDGEGDQLDTSTSTSDDEEVSGCAETVVIHVYGYSGATGDYELTVTVD